MGSILQESIASYAENLHAGDILLHTTVIELNLGDPEVKLALGKGRKFMRIAQGRKGRYRIKRLAVFRKCCFPLSFLKQMRQKQS